MRPIRRRLPCFDLFFENRRDGEYSDAGLPEGPEQGMVLELARNLRPNALGIEPIVEISALPCVFHRDHHGSAIQRARKIILEAPGKRRRGHKRHTALAEKMVIDAGPGIRRGQATSDNTTSSSCLASCEVSCSELPSRHTMRTDWRRLERRRDQPLGNHFRERIHDAHDQAQGPSGRLVL